MKRESNKPHPEGRARALSGKGGVGRRAGLVIVDKPAGFTSHDVVAKMRGMARTRRVGHAGTLDPMATGVLVLGIERATKLLGHLALTEKEYVGTIRLGQTTITDDAEGELITSKAAHGLAREDIDAVVGRLSGAIMQIPSKRQAPSRSTASGLTHGSATARTWRSGPAGHRLLVVVHSAHEREAEDGTPGDRSAGLRRVLVRYVHPRPGPRLGGGLGVGGHLTALAPHPRRPVQAGPGAHPRPAQAAVDDPEGDGLPVMAARGRGRRGVHPLGRARGTGPAAAQRRTDPDAAGSRAPAPVAAFGPDGRFLCTGGDTGREGEEPAVFAV
ncbi:hypothetical protein Scani_81920 [Streptomyces caniferus]|uniref:tRNA pseudouridine(55) synthase n=1 Tax=Streptomyces caniferus TaxID=285557 RepID=A0A640SM33_9ACTN|nr:hypothetical protein Scani_81920 [Streptomyces caniferus]